MNTIDDITAAMNSVLEQHGMPKHTAEDYLDMVGWGSRVLVEKALPAGTHSSSFIDECLQALDSYYHENPVVHSKPYPNIPSLLQTLHEKNIPFGVYSNKTDRIVHAVVERLFPYNWFSVVRGALSDKPTKPSPSVALELAEELGFRAIDIVFVGDSDIDIKTAKAAGMFPVGATWGFRSESSLREAGAEVLLTDPLELFDYVSI